MDQAKVAIVTGAGSGIGREVALRLAAAGYAVVLVGRTRAKLEETAAAAGAGPTLVLAVDVAREDAAAEIVRGAKERFGRIDAVANVAAVAPLQPIERLTPAVWRENIDVNLSAPVLLTAAVWPTFKAQGGGVIVNVSSMASVDPFPGFQAYGAAKAGLNLFTKSVAGEGRKIGVRAVAVAPGAVETPLLRSLFDERALPRARTLTPADVAAVVCGCITGERDFTNGETVILDSPK